MTRCQGSGARLCARRGCPPKAGKPAFAGVPFPVRGRMRIAGACPKGTSGRMAKAQPRTGLNVSGGRTESRVFHIQPHSGLGTRWARFPEVPFGHAPAIHIGPLQGRVNPSGRTPALREARRRTHPCRLGRLPAEKKIVLLGSHKGWRYGNRHCPRKGPRLPAPPSAARFQQAGRKYR
jgi:hypothetical protein